MGSLCPPLLLFPVVSACFADYLCTCSSLCQCLSCHFVQFLCLFSACWTLPVCGFWISACSFQFLTCLLSCFFGLTSVYPMITLTDCDLVYQPFWSAILCLRFFSCVLVRLEIRLRYLLAGVLFCLNKLFKLNLLSGQILITNMTIVGFYSKQSSKICRWIYIWHLVDFWLKRLPCLSSVNSCIWSVNSLYIASIMHFKLLCSICLGEASSIY